MTRSSDRSEPFPARHTRIVLGFDVAEFVLLVLAGLVTAAAVVLIASSNEAAGATMLVGVLVAVGSFRTIQIALQGQITERFTRAIEQLGSAQPAVRLGGLYALERIARDSREEHAQTMEVVTAYVAQNAPWPPPRIKDADTQGLPAATREGPVKRPARDVQAAIAILGRRDTSRREYRLDLSSTNLEGALFAKGERGNFRDAIFSRARLRHARFCGALLDNAEFAQADLEGANLQRASLLGADLETAKNLDKADLRGALFDLPASDGKYRGTLWPHGFDFRRAIDQRRTTIEGASGNDG